MRTAILISGHTREYEKYLKDLTVLKQKFNADIFIASYLDKGSGVRFWLGQEEKGDVLKSNDIKTIHTALNPIQSVYGPDTTFPKSIENMSFRNKLVNVPGSYKMLYKIWEANNLKLLYEEENKFKYDLVIRTRFDLKYKNVDLEGFEPSTIYGARADIRRFASDAFFAADSATMDRVSMLKDFFGTKVLPENYQNCEDLFTSWVSALGYDLLYGGIEVHLRDKVFK